MYEVELSHTAKKQLKKLDKETGRRIISTLKRIRIRPHSHIKKLVSSPYFRLRVGKYRVILDVKNKQLIIFVIEIEHRKKIYK